MENVELPEGVTIDQGRGDLPVIRVDVPSCTAEVYLLGGHLTAWQPTDHEPVIWTSEHSNFLEGSAIRGGVPICFPWFGPGPDGHHYPPHGVARLSHWQLVEATRAADGVRLRLHLDGHDAIDLDVPDRGWSADITYTLGELLDIDLRVEAYGDRDAPFTYEEALHTYLHVGNARRISVDGLDGARYLDKVVDDTFTQSGPLVILGETDRVFEHTGTASVLDPTLRRSLEVSKRGSAQTVVWNPFVTKSVRMGDFGNDEWQDMVCVEAANVGASAITLQPGQSHTLHQRVAVHHIQRPSLQRRRML